LRGADNLLKQAQRRLLMIPRYARPEMTTLWEAESRFSIWLDIETHAMDAMVELGIVPADAAKAVRERL
jgi:adenylosuccinate lyase